MDENLNPELQAKIDAMMDGYLARSSDDRKQQLEGVVAVKDKLEVEQKNAEGKKEKVAIGKLVIYDKPMKDVKVLRNMYDDDGKPVLDEATGKLRTRLDGGWVLTGSIESLTDSDILQRYAVIEKFNDLGQHLVRVVSMKDFADMNLTTDNITPEDIDRYRGHFMNARWLGTTSASTTAEYIDELITRVSQLDSAAQPATEQQPAE
jgi:hypothetical protein